MGRLTNACCHGEPGECCDAWSYMLCALVQPVTYAECKDQSYSTIIFSKELNKLQCSVYYSNPSHSMCYKYVDCWMMTYGCSCLATKLIEGPGLMSSYPRWYLHGLKQALEAICYAAGFGVIAKAAP